MAGKFELKSTANAAEIATSSKVTLLGRKLKH